MNRPALGILPPENFPDRLTESLLSVSAVRTFVPSSVHMPSVVFKMDGWRPSVVIWVLKTPSYPRHVLLELQLACLPMAT